MIVRRPEIWEAMSGEGTDDDISKGIGMSGLQQQQVKAAESPRPGSSGSNSSSSGSWGTCSELLLVSAVKKHGIPNWNSVALELRARAVPLNISPACFTEEACKFQYNALKGKFASSSSGGGSVSSPDDDLNGMSWFEELRKLRMSHLKEELQVYDSSIGQLQSRITKLQEERARCSPPQSLIKQHYDSSCEATPRLSTKDCQSSDTKIPPPTPKAEIVVEISEHAEATNALEVLVPADNHATNDVDGQSYPEGGFEEPDSQKGLPGTDIPQRTGQDSADEVQGRGDLASERSIPLASQLTESEVVLEEGDDQASLITANEAFHARDGESRKELHAERVTNSSERPVLADPSEIPCGDDGDVTVRGDDIFYPALGDDLAVPEKEVSVVLDEGAQGNDSESDTKVSIRCPLPGSPSASVADDSPASVPALDPSDGLDVMNDAAASRVVIGEEASNIRSSNQGDSISKRESRHSRQNLMYGRTAKEKRLKAKEEAKQKRLFGAGVQVVEDEQPSQSPLQKGDVQGVEKKEIKDSSVHLELNENGGISRSEPSPVDEVDARSTEQDVKPDSPPQASRDGANSELEKIRLVNDIRRVDNDHLRFDMYVAQCRSDLLSNKGAGTMSLEDDMPLLTVSLGPDPEHIVSGPPSVTAPALENTPNAENEIEASYEQDVQPEIPDEGKSEISTMIPPETDAMSDEIPQGINDGNRETKIMEGEQGQKLVKNEVMVIKAEEGETVETDPGISRSAGEDIPEISQIKEVESAREESRDSPDIGEVHQPFPDYTDSQIDKSEVGSSMDSIEDMSPSNRKNRREPKVPGKFLPLLECLRVICAHKFAPLFRQRQEYQDNSEYDRLVRRHVDLSMVRARLEDGAYSSSVEFFRDLLLIFTNALVYYSSDSQEYVGAKALRSCALTEMEKILQTEALLKQNGPATRKREVRKSMDVHRARIPSISAGSEVRKKGFLKGSNESPAALDNSNQGRAKSAHTAVEDTPHAGRVSRDNEDYRELDVKVGTTFRKAAASRIVKEETPRKESQKHEFLGELGSRSAGGSSGKKVKLERDVHKGSLQGQVLADLRASSGRHNVESLGTKTTSAKMRDVLCIDLARKGTPNNSSSVVSSEMPEKQRAPPILRQTSTSRVSRYSKRRGDSTSSNPKKRIRK